MSISAIASAVDRATYSFVESAGSTRPAALSSAVICWTTAPAWSVTTMSRNEEPGSAPLVSSAVVEAVVEAVAVAVPAVSASGSKSAGWRACVTDGGWGLSGGSGRRKAAAPDRRR
ncbi:hypothetical protein [Streptomyces sp. ME18-1-4]|uniref:hypothetical protein n=1 Tax=Streptomyces sp. ME18-1-4 TaxID=3028685 RepID=UPI0029B9B45D|nr:hypothetical protein [Streptomyces sp. ME18-1-4]MDX3247162.1 hypothetical protein [Streptomyces sp. ME18-1-4]